MRISSLFFTMAALSSAGGPLAAQTYGPTPIEIARHRTVRIERRSPLALEGKWLYATPDSIAIETREGRIEMPLDSVVSVSERRGSAGKGALVGMLVGTMAGTVAGIAWAQGSSGEYFHPESEVSGALMLAMVGAASGALLGALLGAPIPNWKTRYSSAVDPDSASARRP